VIAIERIRQTLEAVLLDQTAQVQSICDAFSEIEEVDDLDIAGRHSQHEMTRLVDMAHVLRDQISEWIASILRAQGRLHSIDNKLHQDSTTGLLNRLGLDALFEQWWQDDAQRLRLVSCAVVDVDRFGKLNEKLGTRAGDRLLQAFAQLLSDTIRKERGFDRAGRLGGQSFLIFFGDTGPRNAVIAIERIRQTLEAASFEFQGSTFEITASCGISEVMKDDTIETLVRRLQQSVREAKRIGRNRTALDEGAGPKGVDPHHFQIKSRLLHVDEEAAGRSWATV
jgi:diguanylate cyclase (GGDEF)-like protein